MSLFVNNSDAWDSVSATFYVHAMVCHGLSVSVFPNKFYVLPVLLVTSLSSVC